MRSLPVRIDPAEGESFSGYLKRLAFQLGICPGDIGRGFGLFGDDDRYRSRQSALRLSETQMSRIEEASGIGRSHLDQMMPARYEGILYKEQPTLAASTKVASRKVSLTRSRFCPDCLATNAVWQLKWQTRWAVICPTHECFLLSACDECGERPDVVRRDLWPIGSHGQLRDSTRCWSKKGGQLCGAPLTASLADRISDDRDLVGSFADLDLAMSGVEDLRFAGEPVSAFEYLANLHACLFLARLGGQVAVRNYSKYETRPHGRVGPKILDLPGDIAAHLPQASRVASMDGASDLVEWIREMGEGGFDRGRFRLPPVGRAQETTRSFQRCLSEAAATSSYTTSTTRLGIDRRRHRRSAGLDPEIKSHHVPQLFWSEDFDSDLAQFFSNRSVSKQRARRICSALLVRLIEPASWSEADQTLGFPPGMVSGAGTSVEFSRLTRDGVDHLLADAVTRVANRHAARGQMTDFDRLRQQLLSWPGIDPITWRYLLPGRVPKLSQFSDSPIRRELASAWVWAKASSGDFRLAPTGLTRSPYQFELFARSFIPKLEPRLSLLANFVGWNPQQSQSNLRGMLIGQLIEEGRLAPRTTNGHLDEDLAERALRFVSADSGIDRETILAGSKSPAVKAARHLAASLMKTTAGCNWTPIGEYFGTRGNSSSIRPTFKGQTGSIPESLKDRHQVLLDQIRNASVVAPPFSEGGHRGKMDRLALGIREAAATHFDDVSPRSPGSRFSQLICRELTDLTWGAIYRLHGETNQLGARELIALEEAKKSDPGLKTRERHLRVDASALAASVRNGQGS